MKKVFQEGGAINCIECCRETGFGESTLSSLRLARLSARKSVLTPEWTREPPVSSHPPTAASLCWNSLSSRLSPTLYTGFLQDRDGVFLVNDTVLDAMHVVGLMLIHKLHESINTLYTPSPFPTPNIPHCPRLRILSPRAEVPHFLPLPGA